MKRSTLFLLSSTMFLLGTITGFLLAPIKEGLSIGSNNGNSYGGASACKCDESCDTGEYGDEEDIPF